MSTSTITNPFLGMRRSWEQEPPLPPAPPDPKRTTKQILGELNRLMDERKANSKDEWARHLRVVLFAAGLPDDPASRRTREVFESLFEKFGGNLSGCVDAAAERLRGVAQSLGVADDPRRDAWCAVVASIRTERIITEFTWRYDSSEGQEEEELVEGLLIPGQTAVVAGRAKCMKTTLAAHLTACLQHGEPFLGRNVRRSLVVYLTLERSAKDVGRMIDRFGRQWCDGEQAGTNFPIVGQRCSLVKAHEGRKHLADLVAASDLPVVVFLDPLNLIVEPGAGTDLVAAGHKLRALVNPVVSAGATPVLVHHTLKSSAVGEWPGLDDLNGAGVAEFARSWLLLAREREYDGGSVHNLMCVTGTSRGSHERLRLKVDENAWTVAHRPEGKAKPDAAPASVHRPPARKGGK